MRHLILVLSFICFNFVLSSQVVLDDYDFRPMVTNIVEYEDECTTWEVYNSDNIACGYFVQGSLKGHYYYTCEVLPNDNTVHDSNLINLIIVDDRDYPEDSFDVWIGEEQVGYLESRSNFNYYFFIKI